jgi:hypothetical protein
MLKIKIGELLNGADGRLSLRRCYSLYFSLIFSIALFSDYSTDKLTIIAGLIIGLLGLTTAQNIFTNEKNNE